MTEKEKKRRIAQLRAELRELQATPRSDWHTAFEAFLRFKTHKYKGVTINVEVEIGADAPRTDYVILTDDETQEFEESIFRIFRKINILEYKNPKESINERVLYKIAGYACFLIGTAQHARDVPADQVTISIFRAEKNPVFFKKMEKAGKIVSTRTPGIYYVTGITELPFQIVITEELEGKEYAACRALTDKADEKDVRDVIEELNAEPNDRIREYYAMLLSLIVEKNPKIFEEIRRNKEMKSKYPGLRKVFKEEIDEEIEETTTDHLVDIMNKLKYTVEQAMDLLSIPPADRNTYAHLVGERMK